MKTLSELYPGRKFYKDTYYNVLYGIKDSEFQKEVNVIGLLFIEKQYEFKLSKWQIHYVDCYAPKEYVNSFEYAITMEDVEDLLSLLNKDHHDTFFEKETLKKFEKDGLFTEEVQTTVLQFLKEKNRIQEVLNDWEWVDVFNYKNNDFKRKIIISENEHCVSITDYTIKNEIQIVNDTESANVYQTTNDVFFTTKNIMLEERHDDLDEDLIGLIPILYIVEDEKEEVLYTMFKVMGNKGE
ncbi:hypothetical protein [Bacillus cereus]|uniref:hypothetical protein n=1 Tax=Bacillus cereus TaxID=1396 RepID=UPI001F282F5F|nr:hypothetical protein [Bacillus cereus]BCC15158.1 hypothetical protein BCM0074_p256 [Bacillus cereus]